MNCESVQNWLLRADGLEPQCWSPDVADHMQTCSACNSLAYDLLKMEEDWRRLPVPAECESAKLAFLQTLPVQCQSPAPKRRWAPMSWALAAAILFAVGGGAWMLLMSPTELRASSDLVERLIDWNLELTSADASEREQILTDNESAFRKDLAAAAISPEDRELAEKLLETGRRLALNLDPVVEVNLISDLRDDLIVKVESASVRGNERDSKRFAECYRKIMEKGFMPSMLKLSQPKTVEGERKFGFEQFVQRTQQHQKQVDKMMKQLPHGIRPDLRKMLEAARKGGNRPSPFHGGFHRK